MKDEVTLREAGADSAISPSQVDLALHFLRDGNHVDDIQRPLSEDEERRLVRKIDWMLMPLMAATYNFQYLDKTICTIKFASFLLILRCRSTFV